MNYIDERVYNSKYGEGIITYQDTANSKVSVIFFNGKEQKYKYPMCFESALKLLDDEAAAKVKTEMEDQTLKETEKRNDKQQASGKYSFARDMKRVSKMSSSASNKDQSISIGQYHSTDKYFKDFKEAVATEIEFLKKNGSKKQTLSEGTLIEQNNGRYIYSFEAEQELNLPDGTEIAIYRNSEKSKGRIESCEDYYVIISTEAYMGKDVQTVKFSSQTWHLIEALNDRLEEMMAEPSAIVESLICNGDRNIEHDNHHITSGQNTAVIMSLKQPITFIWGPPGTGKTETLARIAQEHMRLGSRVLMLSYSNVSVDGATLRVHKKSEIPAPGEIIRYGYPKLDAIKNHAYLTSYKYALYKHKELLNEYQDLTNSKKGMNRKSEEFLRLKKRISRIHETLKSEERLSVRNAKFVATTVSKAIIDKTIREEEFDVVIFDEASMAYIPQVIFSAGLAGKHFICMGDFKQLPPIVQSGDNSKLNYDIFKYCGIASAVDNNCNHKWLCMLNIQYRMHPQIAGFASRTIYDNLLKSPDRQSQPEQLKKMMKEREPIVNAMPFAGNPLGFFDLSGMMSVCSKDSSYSRVNPLSAFISFYLAMEAARTSEVGIITPYHNQARLLNAMAKDVANAENLSLKPIACATVHQFQGSEKDVIIYDAVDCYRMTHPGKLLNSNTNNYANRLFNVAMTRARGKFIGVANIDYMENKNLSKNLMFGKYMYLSKNNSNTMTGKELPNLYEENNNSVMIFLEGEKANEAFWRSLKKVKKTVHIDIPGEPADDELLKKIADFLKTAKANSIKVHVRAEKKKKLPDYLKPLAVENPNVFNPIVVIDKKVIWFGMPNSKANFESQNRIIQTRFRPIIRFTGAKTAASLVGYLDMNRTDDRSKVAEIDKDGNLCTDDFANYILANIKCPECNRPMRLTKGAKGRFFLACTGYPNCSYTAWVELDLVEKYLATGGEYGRLCPRCGYSLEAKKGMYGIYIHCGGKDEHRFKLNEI